PRTLDIRAPMQEYFDASVQKNFPFPFSKNEKRKIQFRVDLINAFNHPNFRYVNTGNTPPGFGTFPTELTTETEPCGAGTWLAVMTAAESNAWATFNGKPQASTPEGAALLNQIRATVDATRLPSNALPVDFFHTRIPQGFATRNVNSFDITTLEG